jgi:hypothetical protein
MRIDPVRTGLASGLFLAVFHAGWAFLVALGWAQKLMDFIFWAHFITPPYQIEPFEVVRAAILIGVVFLAGAFMGWVAALLWNGLTQPPSQ